MISALFGVSSALIFISFGGFFMLEGRIEWPLAVGCLFFSWLSYKYRESDGASVFFDVRSRTEIVLPSENVAVPVRHKDFILFLLTGGKLFLHNISSGKSVVSGNHLDFLALSPFWCGDKIIVCSKIGLLVFDQQLLQTGVFPVSNSGVSLAFACDEELFFGTCRAEFFRVKLSQPESLQSFEVEGIPCEFFPAEKMLLTSYGVTYRLQNGTLEKILPWRDEVLGFAPFRAGVMLYNESGQVFFDDLQNRSKIASYHKDFLPPFVHNGLLYYTDLDKNFIQMDEAGQLRTCITFMGTPFILRKMNNILCAVSEKSRKLTIAVCRLDSGECLSYKLGLAEVTGLSATAIAFSPHKQSEWFLWFFNEDEPRLQTSIPPLQVLFFSENESCSFVKDRWIFTDGQELSPEKSFCHPAAYEYQKMDLLPLKAG